ncbi:beta-N-acetylhexosaminidase [Janthinobacterium agaricidamnosum]|uniref:Glycosyl hydrolase family 3 N terminal domain protein n=1 Tax=Janthinobacterium agaricidamnosum NBRC 102515 = DSM 9628 TaxID=1349767 RepID=W0UZG4_9BURK|nr:beta-N-acetylhexosaminidase [Janthinobacterium agaricidamnosum]CDG81011.1 glycosyl hydrolase family 3 N terminal domain protein [Janthinobacterium agaricidamnosum NBRC 102515 = DSM 9628]
MAQGLQQKVGQLFMVGFDALQANDHIRQLIRQQKIGGVILFRRNVHTPAQVSALCRELQEINAEVSDVPLLIALDQEGGMVMRIEQGVTPIPAAMAFQQAGSVEDCEQMNFISGDEMRQIGINMLLAPVLDVNNNRLNPVIGVRAYGEEPETVIKYGMAAMRGQQESGVIVTAKHFPGHGDTAIDTHYAMALVPHDKARLHAVELSPFKAAIANGVDAIMTAHVVFPAFEPDTSLPATLSKAVLTDLLRGEMGYQGVVISDCLEMAAISEGIGIPQGAIATLQAGADIVLISHREEQQQAAIDTVLKAVEQGEIAIARIDEALRRVQKLKQVKAVSAWRDRPVEPQHLMKPEAVALSKKLQKAALHVQGDFRPLDPALPVTLITVEVRSRSEIDEVALGRNKEARSSMLPALRQAGLDVREYALSAEALEQEVNGAIAFAEGARQIVVQTYNAMFVEGQRRLLAALPQDKLWLVAGRLPYDLDLAEGAQGRLAAYGCRPAALEPVVEKLATAA